MRGKITAVALAAVVGSCAAVATPSFADSDQHEQDVRAEVMITLRDLDTGAAIYMVCAPVPMSTTNPTYK